MGESLFQRSFAAGELAPVLHARADTVKYATGLRTCRNCFVRREGGVSNRAGFRYVGACKTDTAGTRLMRYVGATPTTSYLIEMGAGYFRFYLAGGAVSVSSAAAYSAVTAYVPGDLVESGGAFYYCHAATTGNAPPNVSFWHALDAGGLYEIPTPYTLDTLPAWNQSGNVITLTTRAQAPRELVHGGPTDWVLREIATTPGIGVPLNPIGVAGAAGALTYRYKIAALATDTSEEGAATGFVTVTGAAPTPAAPNVLSWDALPGATEFYVYLDPFANGTYGYIGTATGAETFNDIGLTPDFALSPSVPRVLFDDAGEFPTLSASYQQRRFFAHTDDEPDAIYGSRTGFLSNFGIASPLQDDDSITFRIAGNNHHPILHMVALKAGLVLLTSGGEWTVTGAGGPRAPLTPSSIDALQETYYGAAPDVRPVVVGNAILYVQARGAILRDLQFDQQVEGLAGRDLTIFSTHLFTRHAVTAIDLQQTPHSTVWCVREDGVLLGLTYIPEQEIWGWHRHDTAGEFEDVCVVPEGDEDALYVVVNRAGGRSIEKLGRREIREGFTHADSFFVDGGLSYSGAAQDDFAGLDHLEGQLVAVLADGVVLFNGHATGASAADLASYTVSGGAIHLAAAATNVHIGLAIPVVEIETLDLDTEGTAIRDKHKRVTSLSVLLEDSARGFYAGPSATALRRYEPQAWEGSASLNTGTYELNLTSTFTKHGRVVIRQPDPLPLTILGVIPHVDLGG